jgi:hypothetical protein
MRPRFGRLAALRLKKHHSIYVFVSEDEGVIGTLSFIYEYRYLLC